MFEKKKEENLEDTKVVKVTGGIEVPKEEGAKEASEPEALPPETEEGETPVMETDECTPCEAPEGFSAVVTLDSEFIANSSIEIITADLDNQLRAIRKSVVNLVVKLKS